MNKQNCTTLKFADLFGLNIVAQTILKSNKYELGALKQHHLDQKQYRTLVHHI